ncbi:hypothetical protein GTS_48630 [Gandjariella thermophila]|uniref:Uncharacterized protein n=1 Tax=Gandjariella thermophila TaxID=1931992 RepID=A0A4D4JDX2_9PSEU|nr:hypothetical protein GTS_48630 [Gandjariella thermophila]
MTTRVTLPESSAGRWWRRLRRRSAQRRRIEAIRARVAETLSALPSPPSVPAPDGHGRRFLPAAGPADRAAGPAASPHPGGREGGA